MNNSDCGYDILFVDNFVLFNYLLLYWLQDTALYY